MKPATLAARARALATRGAGDVVGLAFVSTLIERAETLPELGRSQLLARAETLLASYQTRAAVTFPEPAAREDRDPWREALETRARERAPRARIEERSTTLIAEIRATTATTRAAEQVAEVAGPYNGAVVASRTLDELVSIAPGYVGSYVAWLEDLACLSELPERKPERRTTRRKA